MLSLSLIVVNVIDHHFHSSSKWNHSNGKGLVKWVGGWGGKGIEQCDGDGDSGGGGRGGWR